MASIRGRILTPIGRPVAALVAAALLVPASTAAAATFTVTTTADTGAGSLRQAIADANAAGPGNTIAFAIPGDGPHVITPASALPGLFADGTTIDGCTQPGADCDARPLKLQVQLDSGELLLAGGNGVTIRGLSFTGPGTGISNNRVARGGQFVLSQDLTIERNWFGAAPDGSAAGKTRAFQFQPGLRNLRQDGLRILDNVIASNANIAIDLRATGFAAPRPFQGLRIAGNVIGLDPTGTQPRPNAGEGIAVAWSAGAQIVGNTVASSSGAGIVHRGRAQAVPGTDPALDPGLLIEDNVVEDNLGGGIVLEPSPGTPIPVNGDLDSGPVDVLGNALLDNGAAGIAVMEATGSQRPIVRVGGIEPGQGNEIAGNAGPGVAVGADDSDASVAVTVRGNSIHGNAGAAIDLGSDGPTSNGPAGFLRTGPNMLVNHPLIAAAERGPTTVDGTYAGVANAVYTLDFYASETAEGPQVWIGTTDVATDGDGAVPYHAELAADVPTGWFLHATATDGFGDTSEFGRPAVVADAPAAPPAPAPEGATGGTTPGAPDPARTRRAPRLRKPALQLTHRVDRARLRAGTAATYTLVVRNPSRRALRSVRTCTRLPAGLVAVSSAPRATPSRGRHCWSARRLGPRRSARYALTVRATRGAEGRKAAIATATSPDARSARVSRVLRIVGGMRAGGRPARA